MAKVDGTFYSGQTGRSNSSPESPSNAVDDPVDPINPPGSGSRSYINLTDTFDSDYVGKNGFVPVVTDENGLTLEPLPQIQENGLISGGIVQWTGSGYIFNISSSFYRIGGNPYSTDPSQKTLATPDVTNDRIDVFAVDVNNAVVVIEGTPAATPVKPQIDPSTQLELTSVIVTASSTEPTLTEEIIYDENVEWTGSSSGTGTVSFNSAVDPYQGSVSIETTNIQNGQITILTNSIDVDISTFQTLGFQINLKASLPSNQNLYGLFVNSVGGAVSNKFLIQLDKSISGSYQFVGIALNTISFTSNDVRAIYFSFSRDRGSPTYSGYYLDVIKLEGGINPPIIINSFLGLSDTPSTYSGQGGKTVAVKSDESGLEFVSGGGGSSTFLDLTDTPSSYSGQSGLFPRVNGGETALEFDSVSPFDLDQEGATDGQVLAWSSANSRYQPTTSGGGGGSLWTDGSGFIYRDGPVVVGSTTLPTNATFAVRSKTSFALQEFFQVQTNNGSSVFRVLQDGADGRLFIDTKYVVIGNASSNISGSGLTIKSNSTSGGISAFRVLNSADDIIFDLPSDGRFILSSGILRTREASVNVLGSDVTFKGSSTSGGVNIFRINDSADNIRFQVSANGCVLINQPSGFSFSQGLNLKGRASNTTGIVTFDNSSNVRVFEMRGNGQLLLPQIPTSDPLVTGSLWNDSGTVKISAG